MSEKHIIYRDRALCALIFLGGFWAAWPVVNMGFVDDWSYIKSAQVFARTGHLVYNGWATAMLGWQIPWGALFIKLFGFSFMAVKLSTLPLAVATLLLFHAVLIRFEITPRNAVIGTLTLGLSPLFLPLSASFMTDIPGLFVIVLCLYLCQRALAAKSDRAAIAWLVAAAVTNVVGGTARQVAWLGVLVMVPCTGWLLRKRRGVMLTAVVLWVAGIGAILYCMRWFAQQSYSISVGLLPNAAQGSLPGLAQGIVSANRIWAELTVLLVVVLPVLVVWLPHFGKRFDHYVAFLCVGLLPIVVVEMLMRRYAEIWPPFVLFRELSMRPDAGINSGLDLRRSLVPEPVQIAISLIAIAAVVGCVFAVRRNRRKIMQPEDSESGINAFWLLVPYCVSYLLLLIPLTFHRMAYDRYMLGLMPVAIVASLWLYERCISSNLPSISTVILLAWAFLAIAGTHDWFAWKRARSEAIHELRAAGIPRSEIQGGFAYDGWTQVQDGGHIDNSKARVPAGVHSTRPAPVGLAAACENWFLPLLSELSPRYSVAVGPLRCYLPSRFPAVHYTAWLPPFRRTVAVQRVPGSSH